MFKELKQNGGVTALSSRSGRAIETFLNFSVSHGIVLVAFLRGGEKYYIYFADNSLLCQTVK